MKTNLLKAVMIAVISVVLSNNAYKTLYENPLPENVLANVEAMADEEYDSLCREWVDKRCWQPDQFSERYGLDYYANCSGVASTPEGKLECGAISNKEPLFPYNYELCLQCVRTQNGMIE